MPELQFISAEVCPFAQRTLMALIEKGVEYEHVEVNLRDKPDWFEEVSPYSKVPVLRTGATSIYESAIINEFLEESFPKPALMPADAVSRATARIWIDFDNVKFVPAFYKVLLAQEQEAQTELAEAITGFLRFIEKEALGARAKGPYWLGRDLSLVDLAVYPHMERLCVLEAYRGVEVPSDCAALRDWIAAMAERPSAQQTGHDADYHIRSYSRYADGSADGTTARDMRM